jgi:hypothetical protein
MPAGTSGGDDFGKIANLAVLLGFLGECRHSNHYVIE